jgi:hypothetical protein
MLISFSDAIQALASKAQIQVPRSLSARALHVVQLFAAFRLSGRSLFTTRVANSSRRGPRAMPVPNGREMNMICKASAVRSRESRRGLYFRCWHKADMAQCPT